MILAALVAAEAPAASLQIRVGDGSEALVQVVQDPNTGYRLKVDCVSRCAQAMHYALPVGDNPMGLIDLDRGGLIYSVWGTGCCYAVRIWKVTPARVVKVFEIGSRALPSLITVPGISVVTYMRPTDARGRETSLSPQAIRWSYRDGHFVRR